MESTIIKSRDHFEAEVGEISEKQREQVRFALKWFMDELRKIVDPEAEPGQACMEAGPRCATCAFNPRTDVVKGFIPTAYSLLRAFREGQYFCCHRGQEWKDRIINTATLEACKGFEGILDRDPKQVRECVVATLAALDVILLSPTPEPKPSPLEKPVPI